MVVRYAYELADDKKNKKLTINKLSFLLDLRVFYFFLPLFGLYWHDSSLRLIIVICVHFIIFGS